MSLISRRTFGKSLLASLGLAFLNPSSLVQAQLFGLFIGKGRETPAITSNEDFYVTSYDLTPEIDWNSGHYTSAEWSHVPPRGLSRIY